MLSVQASLPTLPTLPDAALLSAPHVVSAAPFVFGPLFLFLCEYAQRPRGVDRIFVRPGVGAFGVGLIAFRAVPAGAPICSCSAEFADPVPARRLNLLPAPVRGTLLELYDGWDGKGSFNIPSNYDQAIPLIAFINHSDEPNCSYDEATNCIVASRRLRKGEEATVDYLQYQEPGSYTWRACKRGFRRALWPFV